MALPAIDSFTDDNGVQLESHSASWTCNQGDFDIQSNQLASDGGAVFNLAHWNADAFNNAQYSEITNATQGGTMGGPTTRVAASDADGYFYAITSAWRKLYRLDDGGPTELATYSTGGISGDDYRLESDGNTHTPIRNGSTDTSVGVQTDGTYPSGSTGIGGYGDSVTTLMDDWEGGNLEGAPPVGDAVPVCWSQYRARRV